MSHHLVLQIVLIIRIRELALIEFFLRSALPHVIKARSGDLYGSPLITAASTTVKMAVLDPMPSASVITAIKVKPGRLAMVRIAYRKS